MILSCGVTLYDIKKQLQVVYRTCRKNGKNHPKCKCEHETLEILIDQYGNQMTSLREHLSVGYDVEQEKKVHDDEKPR
jgi:hypothetical protein